MTVEQINEKLKFGENETFELKVNLPNPSQTSKLIAALANSKGGQIVVGVQEPSLIVGCNSRQTLAIVEQAKALLNPIPDFSTEVFSIENKEVVVIDVKASHQLTFSSDAVYIRIGERTQPMTHEAIKQKIAPILNNETSIESLSRAIERQSLIIDNLRDEISNSNKWYIKLRDHAISAIIGAGIGYLLGLFT